MNLRHFNCQLGHTKIAWRGVSKTNEFSPCMATLKTEQESIKNHISIYHQELRNRTSYRLTSHVKPIN